MWKGKKPILPLLKALCLIPDKHVNTTSNRIVVQATACREEAREGTQDKYSGTRFVGNLLSHRLEKLDEAINIAVADRNKVSTVSIVIGGRSCLARGWL